MKILGLDSAMSNTGWQVLVVSEASVPQSQTHDLMKREAGGTLKTEATARNEIVRAVWIAEQVKAIIEQYRPDVVTIEGALAVGQNSSPSGLLTLGMILRDYLPGNTQRDTTHQPKYVTIITPERLQSIAHKERKTSGTEVVRRYKEFSGYQQRVTQHEADAYFLAYHGVRFVLTCLESVWPRSILEPKEVSAFLKATKVVKGKVVKGARLPDRTESTAMLEKEGTFWWKLTG